MKRYVTRRRSREVTAISTVLQKSFKTLKLDAILREQKIMKVWDKAVGEKISKKAQPQKVIGSTLYVTVTNSPWMQELNFMKSIIIEKINNKLNGKKVEKIIFKLGKLKKHDRRATLPKPAWLKVSLDEVDKASIERKIASIRDPELKRTFFNILTLEKKLKIYKERAGKIT
jgi:hypothetical protein